MESAEAEIGLPSTVLAKAPSDTYSKIATEKENQWRDAKYPKVKDRGDETVQNFTGCKTLRVEDFSDHDDPLSSPC